MLSLLTLILYFSPSLQSTPHISVLALEKENIVSSTTCGAQRECVWIRGRGCLAYPKLTTDSPTLPAEAWFR